MSCMCGATDCPSCGPAQGYTVTRVWRGGRWRHVNPEDGEEPEEEQPEDHELITHPREINP